MKLTTAPASAVFQAFEAAADRLGIETSSFFNNTLALRRLVQNHVIPGEVDYQSPTKKIYSSMDFGSMLTIYSRYAVFASCRGWFQYYE
jgi:antitoxin component of RelBE/YafQ-DinJ toxin-antitoxin module